MEYIIISPVRNEAERIESTLKSVVSQHRKPLHWLIIDDYSDDDTAAIVRRFLPENPWIRLVTAPVFPRHDYSSRVVQLVQFGLQEVTAPADIVVKLDGDVSFDADFFAHILHEFEQTPRLGIASGTLTENGVPEKFDTSTGNTRGATKCYRKACLDDIGGLYPYTSWDTIDNAAARARGWETRILPYYFEHLKPEGSKAGSPLYNHYRVGMANGRIPYDGLYFTVKALSKLPEKPFGVVPVVQLWGYLKTRFLRKERPFPDFIRRQIRKEQRLYLRKRLSFGLLK